MCAPQITTLALENLASRLKDISEFQTGKLLARAELFTRLEQNGLQQKAHTLVATYIQHSELYDSLRSMSLNEQRTDEQILAIKGFHRFLKQLNEDTTSCCHHINDLIEKRKKQKSQRQQSRNGITLSSCHRAKGLEWPVVLLPGLTRQYWPFLREDEFATLSAAKSSTAIESERRLLYVAMTRAKQQLHLFTAEGDLTGSKGAGSLSQIPNAMRERKTQDSISPFVLEMSLPHVLSLGNLLHEESDGALAEAIQKTGLTHISKQYVASARPSLVKPLAEVQIIPPQTTAISPNSMRASSISQSRSSNGPWQLRAVIDHAIFGRGEVIEVNDSNFSIRFDSRQHGVKRFAKIEEVRHLFRVLPV